MKYLVILVVLCVPGFAWGQGNDFPTFPSLPPFSPPPLITPDLGIPLPTLITPFQKDEAGRAADNYDAYARGADNFTSYWCNLNYLVCGAFAELGSVMRIYSAMSRRLQKDPLDPHFREAVDPVVLSAEALGLSYLPSDHPLANYVNWLIGNTQATWAWEEMVRVTADRAATCLWLIKMPNSDCNWDIFNWQMARLNWGLDNLAYLQNEAAIDILSYGLRDWLWQNGYGEEGSFFQQIAYTAYEFSRALATR